MADLSQFYQNGFNANEGSLEQGGGNNLPVSGAEGLPVVITDSPLQEDQKRPGFFYFKLALTVIDGEFAGEEGNMIIYMVAPGEPTWEAMGDKHLKLVAAATGNYFAQSTEEMHSIPFRVVTKAKPYKDKDGNERAGSQISKILDIDGNPPQKNETATTQASSKPQFSAPSAPATRQFVPKSAPASAPAPVATGSRPPFPFAKK